MENKYLPIGSIVRLNNKKIMITGYYSFNYQNSFRPYDYCGCAYPEGLLQLNNLFSFNHNDISEIIFLGYKNDEFDTFNRRLNSTSVDINDVTNNEVLESSTFGKDGVVIFDEVEGITVNPAVYEKLNSIVVKNPFVKEKLKVPDSVEPQVFDSIENNN